MEFRNLTEAECGQANSLVRLGTHLTGDHAFRETHAFQPFQSESDQLVEQFLQETRTVPQTFRMDGLLREMNEIESQRSAVPPVPASQVKDQLKDNLWAQQYIEDGKHFNETVSYDDVWASANQQMQQAGAAHLVNDDSAFGLSPNWAREYVEQANIDQAEGAAQSEAQSTANKILQSTENDPKFAYSKFMKFMRQVGDGEVTVRAEQASDEENTAEDWSKEFAAQASTSGAAVASNPIEATAQAWASEHSGAEGASYNTEFWDKLQEQWKKLAETDGGEEHPWLNEFTDFYDDNTFKEYAFSDENPMTDVTNPLEVGKQKLQEHDLPSAVLCFEAAVTKEPDNVEAWQLLGTTQAENEQDPNAICALKRCLALEPGNLTALMALAVSYANENYHNQSCQTLVTWLQNNPKYSDVVPPDYKATGTQHKNVQEMFIRAAQKHVTNIDYEVQCGLGVLFNLSSEYDKAVDCFKAALQVKPDDARLWNRLGATLANGNRPEEAVEAYHHALHISPGFIRARYNVGITCINLSSHQEAAEHFLTALNQQAKGRDMSNMTGMSQMSDTIWSTLRMCLSLMNRKELRDAAENRDLATLNQAFDLTDT